MTLYEITVNYLNISNEGKLAIISELDITEAKAIFEEIESVILANKKFVSIEIPKKMAEIGRECSRKYSRFLINIKNIDRVELSEMEE